MSRFALIASLLLAAVIPVLAQKDLTIAQVQGDSLKSPAEGQQVKVRGVVTARNRNGIFIQTPDGQTDNNPATSEGLYVFIGRNGSFSGSIGDLVEATGTIEEFRPRSEDYGFTITELTKAEVKAVGKSPLPAPIALTVEDVSQKNLAALEKFEGMRVKADSLVVTGATGGSAPDERNKYQATSDGVFFATLPGVARPVREAGVDVFIYQARGLKAPIQWFDTNPEMLRVDTDAQTGAKPFIVTAGATVKGVVGVLDYSYRRYTILVDADAKTTVEGNKTYTAVPAATDRELSVGAFNIENFFDDEQNSDNVQKEAVLPKEVFQNKLAKTSMAIRLVLGMPDVLGVIEVENLKALKKLASRVNADAVAAGLADPKYEAYLEEGNDPRGIDSGFLIKSSKVKLLESKQLAKNEELKMDGRNGDKLFDRPPFMVRVQAIDPKSSDPLAVTAVINHFKSYGGIDDPKDGLRIQTKRAQEADWLASWVADRAKADPDERLFVAGDFNAFVVNDGYNDLIGTLIGTPDQNVVVPGKKFDTGLALVRPNANAERYSYVFDGSAQTLDHLLINPKLAERITRFRYARMNADFPVIWSGDASRPERVSDHDAGIAFFSLDPKKAVGPTPLKASTPIQ